MAIDKKDKKLIKKPYFKGGVKNMKAFVRQHLRYPGPALENKIEGTVHLKYTINYKGKVENVKVISGIGYGCDKEAIRLVEQFEFTVPNQYQSKVKFHKKTQIHFRLPKPAPPPPEVSYQYQVVTKKTTSQTASSNSTYYRIEWD